MSDETKAALEAMVKAMTPHIDAIGEMGAEAVEFGWVNDDAEHISEMDWWARAKFGGQDYFVEHHLHPLAALQDLERQLGVQRPRRSTRVYSADQKEGVLAPKEPGRHRWIATAAFALKPSQVQQVHMGNRVNLDHKSLLDIAVGCIDCEMAYSPELRTSPCEGEEYDWNGPADEAGRPPGAAGHPADVS